ncbi:hypothetical protein ACPBZO_20730, partial [Escherichia coli]|uniref:hypothetical protein n=1 Tax=Escherichia coli TaxID=562 RepID=UPI003C2B5874
RAYCLKTQPATGETYPKSDLFNKAPPRRSGDYYPLKHQQTDKKGPANWPALLNRMSLKRNLS